ALRLAIPFSIVVPIAVVPTVGASESLSITAPGSQADIPKETPGTEAFSPEADPAGTVSTEPGKTPAIDTAGILVSVYLAGVLAMLLYFAFSYFRLRLRLRAAVPVSGKVYRADGLESAFVFGIFRQRIYLPSDMKKEYWDCVVRHEEAHIARKDSIRKLAAFLLLAVHWFNPLVWLGYYLFTQDIEIACDEAVSKKMDPEERTLYAETLTELCDQKHMTSPSPVAFGEGNAKTRVQALLKSWKTRTAAIVILVVLIAAGATLFFGNRIIAANESTPTEDTKYPEYYGKLRALVGESRENVLKQLNLTEADLTPYRSSYYYIPNTAAYNGLSFKVALEFDITNNENKDKLIGFFYSANWENTGADTVRDVKSLVEALNENFGEATAAGRQDLDLFSTYTEEKWTAFMNGSKKDERFSGADGWTLERLDDPATLEFLRSALEYDAARGGKKHYADDHMNWNMGLTVSGVKGELAGVLLSYGLSLETKGSGVPALSGSGQ
ncbi:MAG: M56 family metallopeptidase, partial [Lachnospiraceae bacterium]|nr:M56 family metallopeptidase [Lachnospiraceae bacterium]